MSDLTNYCYLIFYFVLSCGCLSCNDVCCGCLSCNDMCCCCLSCNDTCCGCLSCNDTCCGCLSYNYMCCGCLSCNDIFLNLSILSQTIHCDKTLFPYCIGIILCILTPGTPSAHKNGSLSSALLSCKRNWSVHVYGTKLMKEMDYQGHTCTTMVGEE